MSPEYTTVKPSQIPCSFQDVFTFILNEGRRRNIFTKIDQLFLSICTTGAASLLVKCRAYRIVSVEGEGECGVGEY